MENLIKIANAADEHFEAIIKAHGYKSRWDMTITPVCSQALRDAYFAKVDADKAVHEAFVASRKSA